MEITKFIFEILGAFGAIGTFGAFVMLFIKDKYKQEQINKLTNITERLTDIASTLEVQNDNLAKQLRASVLPELWINVTSYTPNDPNFHFDLNNKGQVAKLLEYNVVHGSITLNRNVYLPYDLEEPNPVNVYCRATENRPSNEIEYTIEIIYADKLNHRYRAIVQSSAGRTKIAELRSTELL